MLNKILKMPILYIFAILKNFLKIIKSASFSKITKITKRLKEWKKRKRKIVRTFCYHYLHVQVGTSSVIHKDKKFNHNVFAFIMI